MDSRLLVPATAALLDGWCGPVVLVDAHGGPALAGAHLYRDGRVSVFADWTAAAFDATTVCSLHGEIDRVALDLSRAECRDRVARVLAARVNEHPLLAGIRVGTTAPDFACRFRTQTWTMAGEQRHNGGGGPSLTWLPGLYRFAELDKLRGDDDTRLPDGSRWVDAAALAAVAREVLRCAP